MSFLESAAQIIRDAIRARTAVARLSETTAFGIDEAYSIQALNVEAALREGDTIIGYKLGLTATAKQEQMGVSEPIYGVLLSSGVHPVDAPLLVDELIHPRVEPEIVFILGDKLHGPGVTRADVLAATRAVTCGLEVIDSRYSNFSFTVEDVVADNTSAARIVLGPQTKAVSTQEWASTEVVLTCDGAVVATATGAATMGHPADATALLANWMGQRGRSLPAGALVFTGGLTAAQPLARGTTIAASFSGLGTVSVTAG